MQRSIYVQINQIKVKVIQYKTPKLQTPLHYTAVTFNDSD